MLKIILFLACSLLASAANQALRYENPVLNEDFADPSLLRGEDGLYYAYATGAGGHNLSFSVSKDLVNWSAPREAMIEKPSWARTKHSFWAPHPFRRGDTYYLFYSASPDWAESEHMRIGVAKSASPAGPFVDSGAALDTGDAEENIDPMAFTDPADGKTYLVWGRNGVIAAQELSADLTGFAPGSVPRDLLAPGPAGYEGVVEAPYVVFHGGYYYLYYSGDDCCVKPHYAFLVARAKSLRGPYERLSEVAGRANGAVVAAGPGFDGPGHGAYFTDGAGKPWLLFHAVDRANPRNGTNIRRVLAYDPVTYVDGWPTIPRGTPSRSLQTAPTP